MGRFEKYFLILALVVAGISTWVVLMVFSDSSSGEVDVGTHSKGDIVTQTDEARRNPTSSSRPTKVTKVEETPVHVAEAAPIAESKREITGRVLLPDGSAAVGAKVKTELWFPSGFENYELIDEHVGEAEVSAEGLFSIKVPGHGRYRVQVLHPECAPWLSESVAAGTALEVTLEPGAALTGIVRSEAGKRPLGDAKIVVRRSNQRWSVTTKTDDEGRYRVAGIFAGQVLVSVEAPTHVARLDEVVDVKAGETTEHDFLLAPGKRIWGTVRDDTGLPLSEVAIKVGSLACHSDERGEYTVEGCPPEQLWLAANASGFMPHQQSIHLGGNRDEARVDIRLERGGKIEGFVLDETGAALEGVEVKIFEGQNESYLWETGDSTQARTSTDADGAFTLTGVQANSWSKYRIRARREGMADAFSESIELKDASKTPSVRIIMSAGGAISGRVYGKDNLPLEGVKVTCAPQSVYEWSSEAQKVKPPSVLTDAEGRYTFVGLGEQTYRVSALAPAYATQYRTGLKIRSTVHLENIDFTLAYGEPVRGRVTDDKATPLVGARIDISTSKSWGRGLTDENGEYVVNNVGDGPYDVGCHMQGFAYERKRGVYPENGRIDFELKSDGCVTGRVVNSATSAPVRRFQIALQIAGKEGSWRNVNQQDFRDIDGQFKIHAKDGTYRLRVTAKGYIPLTSANVSIAAGVEPESIDLELVPGGGFEGWIEDAEFAPVAYAQICIRDASPGSDGSWTQATQSELDGYFYLDSMSEGPYELAIYGPDRFPLHFENRITIRADDVMSSRIRLALPTTLEVGFAESDGTVPRNLRFSIESAQGQIIGFDYRNYRDNRPVYGTTAMRNYSAPSSGRRTIRDLPPGSYRLKLRRGEYQNIEEEFVIVAGRTTTLDVELKARGRRRNEETR